MPQKAYPEKGRRTQEERRRETTQKLIDATVSAVNAHGFGGLKASQITKRAGVTWGAVQHLFGDKEALLLAVASRTYEELSAALNSESSECASIEECVEQIVAVTWKAYQSEAYLAMVEILRGSRANKVFHQELVDRQQALNDGVRQNWLNWFAHTDLDEGTIDNARDLVTISLSGLAARYIFLRTDKESKPLLSTLCQATVSVLQQSSGQMNRQRRLTVMV